MHITSFKQVTFSAKKGAGLVINLKGLDVPQFKFNALEQYIV